MPVVVVVVVVAEPNMHFILPPLFARNNQVSRRPLFIASGAFDYCCSAVQFWVSSLEGNSKSNNDNLDDSSNISRLAKQTMSMSSSVFK